uniref:Fimbrial protein n=1 Tax=Gongylonema pulchrum TaxID=637853 RepID=A0A183F1K5_9BILA
LHGTGIWFTANSWLGYGYRSTGNDINRQQ